MTLHAFVAMPFGIKEGIDFNIVYDEYIKPSLESAGFEVFRADEECRAGSIHKDMFQELLLADLVVVDLSIDNPNVWYELGVRHALQARGVIQIQCKRDYLPFDVHGQRTLRYHIKNGALDPDHLEADRKALAVSASKTMNDWHGQKVSPVYNLLPFLIEPDWKSLRVAGAKEFWEAHELWSRYIEVARRKNRPGDILVLAEEAPVQVLQLEGYRTTGKALLSLGQYKFALEQYEKALALDTDDLESRQQKGILLGRLRKYDEARVWLQAVVNDHPDDPESWALLGRVEKDAWINAWREEGATIKQMRENATLETDLLREAIEPYATGFRKDPGHYYSGINAVTLLHLLRHLTGEDGMAEELKAMEGGIRWAVQSALDRNPRDYWARVTLGDLEVLLSDKEIVEQIYKAAVASAEKHWFVIDSSRQQLLLLKDLEFRSSQVEAGLQIFNHALSKLQAPKKRWKPRRVFLFSGHMIDAPDRKEPRFPAAKEEVAAAALAAKLDELEAGPEDLGLCGGACGSDLLFAEVCLERGLRLEIRIPFDVPEFLQKSVTFAGDKWRDRFFRVRDGSNTRLLIMPQELGPTRKGASPYEWDNLWQLYTALAWGPDKVHFICLWNRKGGDGPGGTQHMHDTVLQHTGHVYVLDTNVLW